MSKLTPSQRRQIISDYRNGIQNEDYRVIDRGDGTYQVRKRDSKFKLAPRHGAEAPAPTAQAPEDSKDQKDSNVRMSNEELLFKLSNLLQVPIGKPDSGSWSDSDVPNLNDASALRSRNLNDASALGSSSWRDQDKEKEAIEEDRQVIQRAAAGNPWARRPLSLL